MAIVDPTWVTDSGRHLAKISISLELFSVLFMPGPKYQWHRCIAGLPSDSKLAHFYLDDEHRVLVLVFEHESFPLVQTGEWVSHEIVITDQVLTLPYEETP